MKKFKQIAICAFLGVATILQAQEVQHQSEIIRTNVSKGDYKIIADQYNSHSGRMEITDINQDKAQPNGHFEIILKQYPDHATESTRNETVQFFADNIAFPITYLRSTYEGNSKLQKNVGYVVREGRSIGGDRLVFINDYLFVLHQWQNKDDYQIRYVLKSKNEAKTDTGEKTKKKKKKGFLKSLIGGKKNTSSAGGGASIEKLKTEVLQPYLDIATEKQKSYHSKWIKNSENAKLQKFIDDKREMLDKAMEKYNDDIFNSPEYQRMLAFNKWYNNKKLMTVHNKTGRTIWVGSTKNAHATGVGIDNGKSGSASCDSDMYYYFSDKSGAPGIKFYTSDTACGGNVTVN